MPGEPMPGDPMTTVGCAAGDHEPHRKVSIEAEHNAFDKECLFVKAGRSFRIHLANEDKGVEHNIVIHAMEGMHHPMHEMPGMSDDLFSGRLVTGVEDVTYKVGALEAGTYHFHCEVHPDMHGEIVAE